MDWIYIPLFLTSYIIEQLCTIAHERMGYWVIGHEGECFYVVVVVIGHVSLSHSLRKNVPQGTINYLSIRAVKICVSKPKSRYTEPQSCVRRENLFFNSCLITNQVWWRKLLSVNLLFNLIFGLQHSSIICIIFQQYYSVTEKREMLYLWLFMY